MDGVVARCNALVHGGTGLLAPLCALVTAYASAPFSLYVRAELMPLLDVLSKPLECTRPGEGGGRMSVRYEWVGARDDVVPHVAAGQFRHSVALQRWLAALHTLRASAPVEVRTDEWMRAYALVQERFTALLAEPYARTGVCAIRLCDANTSAAGQDGHCQLIDLCVQSCAVPQPPPTTPTADTRTLNGATPHSVISPDAAAAAAAVAAADADAANSAAVATAAASGAVSPSSVASASAASAESAASAASASAAAVSASASPTAASAEFAAGGAAVAASAAAAAGFGAATVVSSAPEEADNSVDHAIEDDADADGADASNAQHTHAQHRPPVWAPTDAVAPTPEAVSVSYNTVQLRITAQWSEQERAAREDPPGVRILFAPAVQQRNVWTYPAR